MSDVGYVHGSTDAREIARLDKQAAFVAPMTFPTLALKPGDRVLDLATGVGAMATRLAQQFPGIHLVGVDLSAPQLRACRVNHPELIVLRGDATRLPFADGTFDRVHCSWLLEHVPSPAAVLREVHRVLKPGAFCQFIEVQNSTFGITPPSAEVDEVMALLEAAQRAAGGDPDIGVRLEALFGAVGFSRVQFSRPPMRGSSAEQRYFAQFVDEFSDILEGLDESLGVERLALIRTAVAHLRSLPARNGEIRYTPVIAFGWR